MISEYILFFMFHDVSVFFILTHHTIWIALKYN